MQNNAEKVKAQEEQELKEICAINCGTCDVN
mgnify:CR=1 FL=1